MHTARIWMASAIPGGAPGYDDDKEFGNFITHIGRSDFPKVARNIAAKPQKSREGGTKRSIQSLAGFRAFGESEFAVCSHARCSDPVMAGRVPAIHVFAATGAKTWMPGTRPGMTI